MGGRGSGGRANPVVWKRYSIRSRTGVTTTPPVSFHSTYLDACKQLRRMRMEHYRICVDRIEDGREIASRQIWPVLSRRAVEQSG